MCGPSPISVARPAMSLSTTTPAKIGWLATFNRRFLAAPSVIVLIAANLLPLAGVLFWGWDLFTLLLLYWAETGIIGFYAIIQMAILAGWGALFYVPFFVVHFGGFMLGHFLFLTATFGSGSRISTRLEDLPETVASSVDGRGLWLALGALFVSHGVSFLLNVLVPFFRGGRAALVKDGEVPTSAMSGVYGRVIVMHVTILIGALLAQMFGSPIAAFILLIALKTAIDLAAHIRKNFSPDPPSGLKSKRTPDPPSGPKSKRTRIARRR